MAPVKQTGSCNVENNNGCDSLFRESTGQGRSVMLYKLGRFLQVVGMIMLPLAMAGNLVPEQQINAGKMLTLAFIGVAVFLLGYYMQQAGKPR
jgi:hypothetical protein